MMTAVACCTAVLSCSAIKNKKTCRETQLIQAGLCTAEIFQVRHQAFVYRRCTRSNFSSLESCLSLFADDVREREVEDLFAKYGRIRSVDLKSPVRPPAYAFIEFDDNRYTYSRNIFTLERQT